MPECNEIVSMLSDYLDRDLAPEACVVIARHLESCRACGAAAEELRSTVDLCRHYRMESKPGPLPRGKQDELRQVFQKTLAEMKKVP
jgi:predicted anti-sigma-YlaC factor YlaD